MPLEEKNKISHRGRATEKLMEFLSPPLPRVSILGAGNIAWHFATQLHAHGYRINCIYNHRLENAKLLADSVNAYYTNDLYDIPTSDLYLLAVKDENYSQLISEMTGSEAIYVHTSGSLDMEILKPLSKNYGVLYPFQTLTKERQISFQNVPLCIEASNELTLNILSSIANNLASPYYAIHSQQRTYLHLCGVFASNFTNAMYGIAEQIAKEQQIDFEILKPLIAETARKIETLSPADAQTGPVQRNDQDIVQKHIDLLANEHLWQAVYRLMSDVIMIQKIVNEQEKKESC
jgi:predicted short-subunit dehydrogenase-like oxidoreductase (DUF2520 family)